MAHTVEGNDTVGYRVIGDDGPLTGRKATEEDARALIPDEKPKRTTRKKS